MSTAMRSAADIDEVGWPDPAALLIRMESTRSCCPRSRHCSCCVLMVLTLGANCLPAKGGGPNDTADGLVGRFPGLLSGAHQEGVNAGSVHAPAQLPTTRAVASVAGPIQRHSGPARRDARPDAA